MDVWDYFNRRRGEFDEMSVNGDSVGFYEAEGSEGMSGRLMGHVFFSESAYLDIQERIVIRDGTPHRVDYGYFFIVDGVEYWGYERDLTHDPPVHRHTYGHEERIDADPVSFKDVCALAWDEVSRL